MARVRVREFQKFRGRSFRMNSLLATVTKRGKARGSALLNVVARAFALGARSSVEIRGPLYNNDCVSTFGSGFELSPAFSGPGNRR